MVEGIFSIQQGFTQGQTSKNTSILHPGEILPGIVLEANPENAVIWINGINVVAELETTVVPGEKLMLQVLEQRPDAKVVLQKVASGQGHGGQAIAQDELEAVVNCLGLKSSRLNETIIRELLQLNAPVTRHTVQLLSSLVLKHGFTLKEAPALTWLWANGLPITKESVNAAVGLMSSGLQDTAMSELVHAFSKNPLEAGPEIAAPAPSIGISETEILSSKAPEIVEKLLLMPDETQRQWAQKLLDTVKNLGLGHEKEVLRLLEQAGRQAEGAQDIKDSSSLSKPLKGEESSTLKAVLMELVKTEGQPGADNMSAVNSTADKLLKSITGFQLLNLAMQQEADGVTTFFPGWMAMQDGSIQPFFLKLKQYYKGTDDPEEDFRCQVLFFISTKEMGEVICRLALEKRCLTCGFTVRGEGECRLLDSLLPVLESRLQSLPWRTVIYPSKVSGSQQILQDWYEETFLGKEGSFRGLDARV